MKNINKTNEMNMTNMAPNLNNIPKENPFRVPDGYFQDLEQSILKQTKNISPKKSSWTNHPYFYFSVAAILIFAVIFSFYKLGSSDTENKKDGKAETMEFQTIQDSFSNYNLKKQTIERVLCDSDYIMLSKDFNESKHFEIDKIHHIADNYNAYSSIYDKHNHSLITERIDTKKQQKTGIPNDKNEMEAIYQTKNETEENSSGYEDHFAGPFQGSDRTKAIKNEKSDNTIFVESIDRNMRLPVLHIGNDTCVEKAITLDAGNYGRNYAYAWSTGERSQSIRVNKTGIYSVTISNKSNPGITLSDQIRVNVLPAPNTSIEETFITGCQDKGVKLDANVGKEYSYKWYPSGQTSPSITANKDGMYVVEITGCNSFRDTVFVTLEKCDLIAPKTLSPKDNNTFFIQNLKHYPNTRLEIYNERGTLIYKTTNYTNDWDGKDEKAGLYYYFLSFDDKSSQQGTFTITK